MHFSQKPRLKQPQEGSIRHQLFQNECLLNLESLLQTFVEHSVEDHEPSFVGYNGHSNIGQILIFTLLTIIISGCWLKSCSNKFSFSP